MSQARRGLLSWTGTSWTFVVFLVLTLFAAACDSSNGSSFEGDGGLPEAARADAKTAKKDASKDTGGTVLSTGPGAPASISITPANQTVIVANGVVPAPLQLTATGKTAQGVQTSVTALTWGFDRPDIGSVDGTGAFTATGTVGGTGNVTVSSGGVTGTTPVTVVLQMTLDPAGLATTLGPLFVAAASAATADPLLAFDYPYDQTVFPRGLPAPVPQWCLGVAPACTGNATDVYDLKITTPGATFEAFTTTSTPTAPSFSFPTTPVDVWATLTSSTTGPMTFSLARYDGTAAYGPVTETWTIAAANLAGTIYYWEIDLGTVVKMPVGQGPGPFLQIPTNVTPAITCVACHSVSRNGSTVVAAFNGSASPWGSFDTATGTSLFVDGTDSTNGPAGSGFEAISPDGSWVLWGQEQANPYLTLNPSSSATSVAQMNPGVGFPVHPAWSPDGNHVAYAVRSDGDWLDYTTSDLWVTDVTLAASPPTFTNPRDLVPNVPTRTTTTYPSFSPDSQWLAFERSTQVRARGAESELWLTSLDGQTVMSLDAANMGTGLYTQTNASYEPTFMPVAVGGYFWLVFVSERVYGNTLTDINEGDENAPGRHKQLWVTAIDAQPTPGKDPSHPAFWLPGQNTADQNMRGEWALDPCKAAGQGCSGGYECCAGFCVSADGGSPVCTTQSAGCSGSGDACKTSADCCSGGLTCLGGFCTVVSK